MDRFLFSIISCSSIKNFRARWATAYVKFRLGWINGGNMHFLSHAHPPLFQTTEYEFNLYTRRSPIFDGNCILTGSRKPS